MHTVGCAVCTVRDYTSSWIKVNWNELHRLTHINRRYRKSPAGAPGVSMRACVCVYVHHKSNERKKKRKKNDDSKTKKNRTRLREVIILTFIFLPPLHLNGQKFTGYKFTNTKHRHLLYIFKQEMSKYHSNVTWCFLNGKPPFPPLSDSVYA